MIKEVLKHFGGPDNSLRLSHIHPLTCFDLSHLEEEALKSMRTGHHTGKLVLTCDESTLVAQLPQTILRPRLSEDGIHIVAGGAGGIGRVIGRWMLERGAKQQIALLSFLDVTRAPRWLLSSSTNWKKFLFEVWFTQQPCSRMQSWRT